MEELQSPEEALFRQMKTSGLTDYAQWLVNLENSDPECIEYPRFKISDDKSAVWIELD